MFDIWDFVPNDGSSVAVIRHFQNEQKSRTELRGIQ